MSGVEASSYGVSSATTNSRLTGRFGCMKTITLIEPVDMSKPMYGNGIATVVASAIRVMGDRLILVGLTSDEKVHPVGKWCETTLFGRTCQFFPIMTVDELNGKYVKNLSFAIRLIRLWKTVVVNASKTVITQNYLVMWWLARSKCFSCRIFYFPGLANPVLVGRKPGLGKMLARCYDRINLYNLQDMDLVLAAASRAEIDSFRRTWHRDLHNKPIAQLTTSVDIDVFSPRADLEELKKQYAIAEDVLHFVCVGRLAKVKGIDFLIDALGRFSERYRDAALLLVGDGEERESLRRYAEARGLGESVRFLGNLQPSQVRDVVNCADLCVVGSTFEGFSCAMVEQIACGKPLVSTEVSGASEIINNGINGFIVAGRDPQEFALYMHRALELPRAGERSRHIAVERYSEHVIWNRFLALLEEPREQSTELA